MSSKAHGERLARALEGTGMAEAVNITFGEDRVAVLCRVTSGNDSKWMELIQKILVAALDEAKQAHAWQNHICRNYFIKEDPQTHVRKLVWGWNVSVQSRDMSNSLDMLIKVIKGQPIRTVGSTKELEEFPLHGATANRNAVKGGKGVHTIGDSNFHPARSK